MEKITKEKNIYTFVLEPLKAGGQERVYQLDLNTGVFINAKTGKQLVGNPAGIKYVLERHQKDNCVTRYIYNKVFCGSEKMGTLDANKLVMYDKFDAIKLLPLKVFCIPNKDHIILAKHLGEVAKLISGKGNDYNLIAYVKEFIINDFIKKYNITFNDHFNKEDCLRFIDLEQELLRRNIDPMAYMSCLLYYYQKYLWVFESIGRSYITIEMLLNMVIYANALEVKIPKGDFLRTYAELYKNYQMNKTEIDNKALAQWNYLLSLAFENEDFQVIIPKTVEEFQQEGDSQHNCVYTMYLNKVINKQTRVVFIRRKEDLSQSYITCEVSNNGIIRQYLERYNNLPKDANALQFRKEYQNYLCDLWAKDF